MKDAQLGKSEGMKNRLNIKKMTKTFNTMVQQRANKKHEDKDGLMTLVDKRPKSESPRLELTRKHGVAIRDSFSSVPTVETSAQKKFQAGIDDII